MTETESLPIIDELRATTTYCQMAEWLGRVPLHILCTHCHEIAGILEERSFTEGADYLNRLIAVLANTRPASFALAEIDCESDRLLKKGHRLDFAAAMSRSRNFDWWQGSQQARGDDD